ncbi:cell division control protein [Phialemonium atrogriseum]|uniref:Cell division control protein n=1 Tax=Phialemonium atrogriseum TaxID=1093897 RepID=A0AAJ0C7T8_9PEZI|nr:cell division control protein [Phialemonium atrogriseum]KAK1771744.1 cell division control protein [Phialemonium atrogriseum]
MAGRTSLPIHGAPPRDDYNKLPEEQKTQINEAFELFDNNDDGRLDYNEFRFCMRALGFELPKQETYGYLTKYGIPPAGWPAERGECTPPWRQFTLQTTQAVAGQLMAKRDPMEELRRAFRLFDVDSKGIITAEDLQRVSREIGQALEDSEIQNMIQEFDSNGKGGVSEDEFTKLMMSKK